jgi:hypothetical protein
MDENAVKYCFRGCFCSMLYLNRGGEMVVLRYQNGKKREGYFYKKSPSREDDFTSRVLQNMNTRSTFSAPYTFFAMLISMIPVLLLRCADVKVPFLVSVALQVWLFYSVLMLINWRRAGAKVKK